MKSGRKRSQESLCLTVRGWAWWHHIVLSYYSHKNPKNRIIRKLYNCGKSIIVFLTRMMMMKLEMTTTTMMGSLFLTVTSQRGKEHLRKMRYVRHRSFNLYLNWITISRHDDNGLILQEGGDPEKQKVRQKIKAREWENELMSKGRVNVLEPVVRVCWWEGEAPTADFLQPYAVCMLKPLPKDEGCTPERDLSRQQRNEKCEYSMWHIYV